MNLPIRPAEGRETAQAPIPYSSSGSRERRRFWEIDSHFKCPLVGMCLSLSEQRQLLKKAGVSLKGKTPFMIHEVLVACSDRQNPLSKKVDDRLDRKYSAEREGLAGLDEVAFREAWEASFASGDFHGALWTAVTRPDLSLETRREIFGAVHMAMHETGNEAARRAKEAGLCKRSAEEHRQRHLEIRGEYRTLKREHKRLRAAFSELERKQVHLEARNDELDAERRELRDRNRLPEIEQRVSELEAETERLRKRSERRASRIRVLETEKEKLSETLERERAAFERFQTEARGIMEQVRGMSRCDETCPSFDLCRKRILMVGGLTRMEELYRRFIEESGGIFEYHDGKVKRGVKGLEDRFKRADVVLCSVSCNSHAACSAVKTMAKRHNKPVHYLASSSLNAVFQALAGNGGAGAPQH